MECERCKAKVDEGDERVMNGQTLCEDCYMDLLSPAKACDPWAVYTAKSLQKNQGGKIMLTPLQEKIITILKEGPIEALDLSNRLEIKMAGLERELAALRHMEKIRGELKNSRRLIRLWE
jgi:hypothetical protein